MPKLRQRSQAADRTDSYGMGWDAQVIRTKNNFGGASFGASAVGMGYDSIVANRLA